MQKFWQLHIFCEIYAEFHVLQNFAPLACRSWLEEMNGLAFQQLLVRYCTDDKDRHQLVSCFDTTENPLRMRNSIGCNDDNHEPELCEISLPGDMHP
jgi:hypothetical protein